MANNNNSYSEEEKELFKQYDEETGKKAVWRGKVTQGFKDWKDELENFEIDELEEIEEAIEAVEAFTPHSFPISPVVILHSLYKQNRYPRQLYSLVFILN